MMADNKLKGKARVCVVVLGDFGRSPRMQYHTMSLASHNYNVDVVAYKGAEPRREIRQNKLIALHYMRDVPKFEKYLPRIVTYVLKTLWQSLFLFLTLIRISNVDSILLQNPPSIPTLPITWFVSILKGCDFIIDFHNYGYTILSLTLGPHHILVKICRWCEMYFGRKALKSICVSKAMKVDLKRNWNIRATTFYDCAPDIFHPITTKEKHLLLKKVAEKCLNFQSKSKDGANVESTRFTSRIGETYEMRVDRPALIVSSTSWTEDEDFSILLSALEDYEQKAADSTSLPNLVVAITGKGPLRSYYENIIKDKEFVFVEILMLWLKSDEYPTFLACADLGVSLHSSSSGLDLPMKIVDMFGCCLPVCAHSFSSIGELVEHGVNGLIFSNCLQLSRQFQRLFKDFPEAETSLMKFRRVLTNSQRLSWEENWNFTIHTMFAQLPTKTS